MVRDYTGINVRDIIIRCESPMRWERRFKVIGLSDAGSEYRLGDNGLPDCTGRSPMPAQSNLRREGC